MRRRRGKGLTSSSHRVIEPSSHRGIGSSGHRAIWASDHRAIGASGDWAIGAGGVFCYLRSRRPWKKLPHCRSKSQTTGRALRGMACAREQAMRPQELRERTKQFALEAIRLFRRLPKSSEYLDVGRQLYRSGNSMAANYRAAGCARSHAEFVAKIGSVREEADESQHWVGVLTEMGLRDDQLPWLRQESKELAKIFESSYRTASGRRGEGPKSRARCR